MLNHKLYGYSQGKFRPFDDNHLPWSDRTEDIHTALRRKSFEPCNHDSQISIWRNRTNSYVGYEFLVQLNESFPGNPEMNILVHDKVNYLSLLRYIAPIIAIGAKNE